MPPPKPEPAEEDSEDWLTTYADAITLLMAFFVMLLTFAEFDIPAYEELTSAIASSIGNRDEQTTTESLKIDVQDIVYESQADQAVSVESDDRGVVIELQSNAFFKPGSAELVPAAIPVLQKLSETLTSPRYELYNVVVAGHTDDGSINTPQFPSNWELSGGRAATVVRLFVENKVDRIRLHATGLADTRPKVPNNDLDGTPIPENRAANRRVALHLSPMSLKERDAYVAEQEFKRRLEEKKNQESGATNATAAPHPIEQRLPIEPTPDHFNENERLGKQEIDKLKKEIHSTVKQHGQLSSRHLSKFKSQFVTLAEFRSQKLARYFEEVEQFFGEAEHAPGDEAKEKGFF